MMLEHGATYAAELDLPSIPFVNVMRRAEDKLTDAGFAGPVRVWKATDGKTYARGVWLGETQDVELPPQVVRAWKVA